MKAAQISAPDDGRSNLLATPAPVIPAHPEKPQRYSSQTIQERRQRIMSEARKLIAEEGVEGFSIRKLCARAGVVQRTLYNAFQSKERIIALAISNAYDQAHGKTQYVTDSETIYGVLDRMYAVNYRNLRAFNYVKAVVSLYFAPGLSSDILDALRAMVLFQRLWLERCEREGSLRAGIDVDVVVIDLANLEYSVLHDWVEGRMDDTVYLRRLLNSFLTYIYAITIGEEHDRIGSLIDRLGKLKDATKFHDEIVSAHPIQDHLPPAR